MRVHFYRFIVHKYIDDMSFYYVHIHLHFTSLTFNLLCIFIQFIIYVLLLIVHAMSSMHTYVCASRLRERITLWFTFSSHNLIVYVINMGWHPSIKTQYHDQTQGINIKSWL